MTRAIVMEFQGTDVWAKGGLVVVESAAPQMPSRTGKDRRNQPLSLT